MSQYDLTLITEQRLADPEVATPFFRQVMQDDVLLTAALEQRGLKVFRTPWDDPQFNWSRTRAALFRTPWDYYYRYDEFRSWLTQTAKRTILVNPPRSVLWNLDKKYLLELARKGIPIPSTLFIPCGSEGSLASWFQRSGWSKAVLKPCVSASAWHTFLLDASTLPTVAPVFRDLNQNNEFLLQAFQEKVPVEGERSLVIIEGQVAHAELKLASKGDFRVQEEFGGYLQSFTPSPEEAALALRAVALCPEPVLYARVDLITRNDGVPALMEMELMEPELWLRRHPDSVTRFADAIARRLSRKENFK